MNNRVLLHTSMMTPIERSMGRFMRAPDGHGDSVGSGVGVGDLTAGNDSAATQNNQQGNSGDSNASGQSENNNGQPPVDAGFWEKKEEGTGGEDDGVAGQELGQRLAAQIQQSAIPPVFTKELADQIAEGNFEGINKAMVESHQNTMKQSIAVFGTLLEAVTGRLTADFESRIQRALGGQKANDALETHFPAAKDPAVRPIIDRVYQQSLVNTKGNVSEAVKQTEAMLKAFGTKTGLTTPPADPEGNTDQSRSLVDELLGRGG